MEDFLTQIKNIEAADVVLMDDNPMQIAKAIKISKKCIGIVRQNITFALSIKFACLILSAVGIANMWLAISAHLRLISAGICFRWKYVATRVA